MIYTFYHAALLYILHYIESRLNSKMGNISAKKREPRENFSPVYDEFVAFYNTKILTDYVTSRDSFYERELERYRETRELVVSYFQKVILSAGLKKIGGVDDVPSYENLRTWSMAAAKRFMNRKFPKYDEF